MIFQPAVFALILVSVTSAVMVLYAAIRGVAVIRRWDLGSGSEEQLRLERLTYLISMVLSYALAFEVGSLFLFIFAADDLHSRFIGAMCAAGSLHVNPYGYPALVVKVLNAILAGLWLIVNFVDNRAYDYPLIRPKYAFLLFLAPFFLAGTFLEISYFLNLKGDVITSCCGSLFSPSGSTVASEVAGIPPRIAVAAFFGVVFLVFAVGVLALRTRGPVTAILFSVTSGAAFLVSIAALISFISLYFYELPTHHCPFCVLQREYGYVGYLLYASLLAGVISGLGAGVLAPFRKVRSLSRKLPVVRRRLIVISMVSCLLFAGTSMAQMILSGLRLMEG